MMSGVRRRHRSRQTLLTAFLGRLFTDPSLEPTWPSRHPEQVVPTATSSWETQNGILSWVRMRVAEP